MALLSFFGGQPVSPGQLLDRGANENARIVRSVLVAGVDYLVPMSSADDNPAATKTTRDVASVERIIAAPADEIFAVLADPARHCEFDGSGSVHDVAGTSERLHLGSVFGIHMKKGAKYTMDNTVVEFVDNELIGWEPRARSKIVGILGGGRIWRYELERVEGGTLVRETWDIRREQIRFLIRPLRAKTIEGMTKSLEQLEALVTH